mmetsp:Transcript_53739/g.107961  ORF Transcript_53739/g.107961 Transcript_53739/m.107961 type:complete len:81 (-) Transcript_53739:442-684(-)
MKLFSQPSSDYELNTRKKSFGALWWIVSSGGEKKVIDANLRFLHDGRENSSFKARFSADSYSYSHINGALCFPNSIYSSC